MPDRVDWREAFLGVSALLGEPVDDALSALAPALPPGIETLAGALRSPDRRVRAEAIARAVTAVARELEGMRLG